MIFVKIESVKKKYTPKNATVTVTTMVVEITSARPGQFTCRISTRTSCRNERKRFGYPPSFCTGSKSANPLTRWDSSSRLVRIASAISLRTFVGQLLQPCYIPCPLHHQQTGRGGGIRTPTLGFGDRWSTVKPTPLNSSLRLEFSARARKR